MVPTVVFGAWTTPLNAKNFQTWISTRGSSRVNAAGPSNRQTERRMGGLVSAVELLQSKFGATWRGVHGRPAAKPFSDAGER